MTHAVTRSVNEALTIKYDGKMYKRKPFYSILKRSFDIFSSLLAIILFSWLFIILALLVGLTSKGPIFYGHKRIGKNGKEFTVWKFRSMKMDNRPIEEVLTPEQLEEYRRDFKVTNDPRVTKVGKFLRKTSLDELPQLFNILVGQMSVIGWRPIVQEELDRYSQEEQELLLRVRPGLTGYWACHGRSNTTYSERIKFELYYSYKRNAWLDIRILYHTIIGVFKQDGAR
ncbi:MAG: sugar transferase [Acholeplasmatales bacterium]|nr:sugar transferase [Acholeplasmatales bacterium]